MEEDGFSSNLKGIDFSLKLRALYLAPAMIFVFIAISQIFDFLTFIFLVCFYYIAITILIVIFLRKIDRKEALEKREMQDSEDKFYKEYFRKKGNQL